MATDRKTHNAILIKGFLNKEQSVDTIQNPSHEENKFRKFYITHIKLVVNCKNIKYSVVYLHYQMRLYGLNLIVLISFILIS